MAKKDEDCPCESCVTTGKVGLIQVITILLLTVALGGGFWGIGKTSAQEAELGDQEKRLALLEQSQATLVETLRAISVKIDNIDNGVAGMDKKLEVHIAGTSGRAVR